MSNDNKATGQNLDTSEGARAYVAEYFANQVGRHDFRAFITTRLAADFACALAQHLAARQPVGQEPVLWVSPDVLDAMATHRAQNFPAGGMGLACPAGSATVPLYAAPPAQAVDLGQFRALAAKFDGLGDEDVGDAYSGPYYECARQLRALIDSQAVRNG